MGLSFSVAEGIKLPPSLLNIFKELHKDVGCSIPSHGNLERWAVQVTGIIVVSVHCLLCILLGYLSLDHPWGLNNLIFTHVWMVMTAIFGVLQSEIVK